MAIGRMALAVMSLAAPHRFAGLVGVAGPPELTYMTRIYGARAMVMGLGYLTGDARERHRWKRFALAVDIADTLTGIAHLLRNDVPPRAAAAMVALTGSYTVLGAIEVVSEHPSGMKIMTPLARRHVRRRSSAAQPTRREPRYVDPYRPRGRLYRGYAGFIGSEPVRRVMPHLFWKLDAHVTAATGGRFGLPLMLPTALLETRGAKTGAPRQNLVLYFHDGQQVIVIALNGARPNNPAWYYNLQQNPDVRFGGRPMRASVVHDDTERERLWHLGSAVFAPYAKFRRIAAATGRDIPVIRLTPAGTSSRAEITPDL
ncbi:nitroreductase/quinone reductase family protein [Nocardia miyunensis]|uniref:nitroreductase/quinone reductase family protein n=1 Tax=Nocardia miyunensis TaxID=282684 RepID=UPI001471518E|nr:nitroreductase/quinone reductase family protein [Nocardia miyunensis]